MLSEVTPPAPRPNHQPPQAIDEPPDVPIKQAMIRYGHAVKVSENFGIHITQISNLRERVQAMGPDPEPGPAPEDGADQPETAPAA